MKDGFISEDSPIRELGEMINGVKAGRESEEQITVCDLTGVGVQDTMIAIKAYDLAVEQGMGTKIPR